MTEGFPDEDGLFEEAVDLLIRLSNDPGNPVALEMTRRWRHRSPEHENAWAEAVEIHGMTGKILGSEHRAGGNADGPSRRTLVTGGVLAMAAAAAAGTYAAPGLFVRARADHMTATAEVRRIALADGSFATLGPDSALSIHFANEARRIELLKGMAFFEVAADRGRPFSVEVAGVVATAFGTAFDVSQDAGFVTVAVEQGLVGVQLPSTAPRSDHRLDAGEWVRFGGNDSSVIGGSREASQFAAWRDGLIFAEKEPIIAVVARIARWYSGNVVIASPALSSARISGVFDLRDPISALEAVVHPYGGKVRRISRFLTVVSQL